MAKKSNGRQAPRQHEKPAEEAKQGNSLKDLLGAATIQKLKAQADEMKLAEQKRKEEKRRQEEEAKKQEQKRLENDFAYLLDNSDPNWGKFK
ncbi:YqkE family protein [Paenibacillus soyae]|uniref:YqkE family protein n=1 Tax=Paenibacillus soyae TaxID=2969249 RepID=A0A9X2MLQ0_9BACL|nr:YqkE family protein [Paenibacillus soyae]MCR2802944.1 YqkE family protein [Paenibacillus soyae]